MKKNIFKRIAALSVGAVVTAAMATTAFASTSVNGLTVFDNPTDNWAGANIILGSDQSAFPFADGSGQDNPVAALNVKADTLYHLSFNVTSSGAAGIRVRWITDDTNGSYTAADSANVKTAPYSDPIPADQTATLIPAFFADILSDGDTQTFNVDFKLDSSEEASGFIGNLAIRGESGSNDFTVNWVKVTDESGTALLDWSNGAAVAPAAAAPAVTAAAAPAATTAAAPAANPQTGDSNMIFVALGVLALAGVGAVVFSRKAKQN